MRRCVLLRRVHYGKLRGEHQSRIELAQHSSAFGRATSPITCASQFRDTYSNSTSAPTKIVEKIRRLHLASGIYFPLTSSSKCSLNSVFNFVAFPPSAG